MEEKSGEPDRKKRKIDDVIPLNKKIRAVLHNELTADIPTMLVFAAVLADRKQISCTIKELNAIFPASELKHLKRVSNMNILITSARGTTKEEVREKLNSAGFNCRTTFIGDVYEIEVPRRTPFTREQYDRSRKWWPCVFHPNKYTEDLVAGTLFSGDELTKHAFYMNLALNIPNSGCVIVDPKINSVVAIGMDQSYSHASHHAAMLAIDNVARSQQGGMWEIKGFHDINSTPVLKDGLVMNGIPSWFARENPNVKMGASPTVRNCTEAASDDKPSGPYLCTDYYAYMSREPCTMCGMALIHSRVKRVFYAHPNPEKGALGSLWKLHTIKALNHHYEVFTGFLET